VSICVKKKKKKTVMGTEATLGPNIHSYGNVLHCRDYVFLRTLVFILG
jgi:hypothetical protein